MKTVSHSWFGPAEGQPGAWEKEIGAGSFTRLWRAFMAARATVAAVLVVLQSAIYALGPAGDSWPIAVSLTYLCASLAVLLWARPRPAGRTFDSQWVYTIGVDVVAFSALTFLQPGGINYAPLFALPVLLAAVLGPILLALGTAAGVTLFLLVDAWWVSVQSSGEMTSRFLQSGLSGSGFFLIALLANQLALRVVREEQRSRSSQSVARMQTQVNELVIETLTDGVLVIDGNGIVRSANPASQRLLSGAGGKRLAPFVLATDAAWQPLVEMMQTTFRLRTPQEADVSLEYASRNARRLHVRTRLAASQDSTHESLCVMFLEDLREMEARVRTEKMAAMGRMSAAVAHEIRNPLAAIAQANALLEEDLQDPAHRQLTAMVGQNAQRLAKIVDDILNISRAKAPDPEQKGGSAVLLDETVLRIASEWLHHMSAAGRTRLTSGAGDTTINFDPEHLRRLMVNLLDNALRYASTSANAIEVATRLQAPGHARLTIWSDGPPLENTVRMHLFEPFFSSESRSSGLGLYICRELCERYGAMIGYQRAVRGTVTGNEFFVTFRPPAPSRAFTPSDFDALSA